MYRWYRRCGGRTTATNPLSSFSAQAEAFFMADPVAPDGGFAQYQTLKIVG